MPRHTDEDYINRSLLDSLDAQADAEPVSSSDSDAVAAASFGSSSNSSSGSPAVPFHMVMQNQQQPHRPQSPSDTANNFNTIHHQPIKSSIHNPDPLFIHNSNQNMYNTMHVPSDYPSDDGQKQPLKMNGFAPGPYRNPLSVFPTSARQRQHSSNIVGGGHFRDVAPVYPNSYSATADVYPHLTSPTQPQSSVAHAFESVHHGRAFDYTGSQQEPTLHRKPSFGIIDYGNGPASALLQSHQVGAKPGASQHPLLPQLHQQSAYAHGSYSNGVHVQSQTPYGPHLQTPGMSAGVPASSLNPLNGTVPTNASQEEISTIFVVGFPEDMQEREFQNMFTFSPGFEAATLKIPNKEYNAYGSGGSTAPNGSMRPPVNGYNQAYAGPNDPYNLVTVNQGGVVVDNGRDGTMASWPASVPGMPQDDAGSHFIPNGGSMPTVPPRKQIIGFAKFRSRSEALEARDVLQGRRVDIEKGAVLKAEMAKKNLHTKRGVGPLPLPLSGFSGGGGLVVPDTMALSSGLGSMNGMTGLGGMPPSGGMEISARERELGALGAMGLGGMGQWRDPSRIAENDEDRERRRDRESSVINAMGLTSATRGPRERAEEDERERERRRKEKEVRMRSANMTAFDAFHSVPSQTISRHPSMSLMTSAMDGLGSDPVLTNGYGHGMKMEDDHHNDNVGPWDSVPLNGVRMSSVAVVPNQPPIRPPPSSGQSSPPPQDAFSPRSNVTDLPAHQPSSSESQPGSSASSVVDGPAPGPAPKTALTVATDAGNASPQLPSPVSGASSTSARNVIDQNPPINTLYVGNLPTSSMSGYPPNHLEDNLRELFQRRPGFRKLCFRQKSNGPMCFVEFEDVNFATKALNDLYGHTLGGLIKGGGIRLSYSKNPLGVRTPTSASSNGSTFQQQQLQASGASSFPPDAFQPRSTVEIGSSSSFLRGGMTSPQSTPSFNYISSPPPRFFSPTPSAGFGNPSAIGMPTSSNGLTYPRSGVGGFVMQPHNSNAVMSTFSPFGISTPPHSTIPASD